MALASFARPARGGRLARVGALLPLLLACATLASAAETPTPDGAKAPPAAAAPKRPAAPVRVTKATVVDVPVVLDLVGEVMDVDDRAFAPRIGQSIERVIDQWLTREPHERFRRRVRQRPHSRAHAGGEHESSRDAWRGSHAGKSVPR